MAEAFELNEEPLRYEPLPDPAAQRETNTFSSEAGGLRDAARELNDRRAEAKPIIERHYHYTRDTPDHKAGDPLDPHFTITAQRGARELADMRRGEAETAEFLAAQELAQEVDLDRANEHAARTGQPAPEVQEALHQAEMELAQFPEMQGVTAANFPQAMQILHANNPQRAAQIVEHLQRTKTLMDVAQQHQAAQAQQAQAQFEHYKKAQDDLFDQSIKHEPRETVTRVLKEIGNLARDVYGVSEDELLHHWNTNPIMRSATMQRVLYDAAKYHLAQRGIAKAPPKLPPVLRPGVREAHGTYDQSRLQAAAEQFRQNPNVRTAAKKLLALRASRAANAR